MPVRVPPVGTAADTAPETTSHDQNAPLPGASSQRSTASAPTSPSGPGRAGEVERRRQLQTLDPEALRALAVSMPVIEQAKGVLMAYYGCDADQAFAVLCRWSSVHQVKIRDLATLLVEHTVSDRPGRAAATDAAEQWAPFGAVQAFLDHAGLP